MLDVADRWPVDEATATAWQYNEDSTTPHSAALQGRPGEQIGNSNLINR